MKKSDALKEEYISNIRKARRVILAITCHVHLLEYDDYEEVYEFDRSMQLSRMWLGKLLSYTGTENPYAEKDGNRKDIQDIGSVTDDYTKVDIPTCILVSDELTYIELVDKLRGVCNKLLNIIDRAIPSEFFINQAQELYAHMCIQQVWKYIHESRMWLGAVLGRIRDDSMSST